MIVGCFISVLSLVFSKSFFHCKITLSSFTGVKKKTKVLHIRFYHTRELTKLESFAVKTFQFYKNKKYQKMFFFFILTLTIHQHPNRRQQFISDVMIFNSWQCIQQYRSSPTLGRRHSLISHRDRQIPESRKHRVLDFSHCD